MAITQDVETQKNGIVCISWSLGTKKLVPRSRMVTMEQWYNCLPVRMVSHHICMDENDDGLLGTVMKAFLKFAESQGLARLRFHLGTSMECVYNLLTFGIPRDALPITDLGSINLSNHHRMLELLCKRCESFGNSNSTTALSPTSTVTTPVARASEEDSSPDDVLDEEGTTVDDARSAVTTRSLPDENGIILIPNNLDLILGKRGHQPTKRPGLLRMHHSILKYQDRYEAQTRNKKIEVAKIVCREMKDSGCRFIMEAPSESSSGGGGGYIVCDDKMALEKISHGFRNLRMKKKHAIDGSGVNIRKSSQTRNNPPTVSQKRSFDQHTTTTTGSSIFDNTATFMNHGVMNTNSQPQYGTSQYGGFRFLNEPKTQRTLGSRG